MSKKVLILCQRKQGLDALDALGASNVKDSVIPLIEKYVEKVLGPGATIEYLTNGEDDTVEYNFTLEKRNSKAVEFVAENRSQYSLIILNTCPLAFMDYELIYSLLEPGGFMVFQSFPKVPNQIREDFFSYWSSTIDKAKENMQFLEQYFRHIPSPDFDPENYHVYQKIERGGGKYNLKKNNKKTIKKRNYKKRNSKKRNNKKSIKKRNFSC